MKEVLRKVTRSGAKILLLVFFFGILNVSGKAVRGESLEFKKKHQNFITEVC